MIARISYVYRSAWFSHNRRLLPPFQERVLPIALGRSSFQIQSTIAYLVEINTSIRRGLDRFGCQNWGDCHTNYCFHCNSTAVGCFDNSNCFHHRMMSNHFRNKANSVGSNGRSSYCCDTSCNRGCSSVDGSFVEALALESAICI